MKLKFVKMSGAGNDFIVLDNIDSSLDDIITPEFIRNLCARGMSVGADGLLELLNDNEFPFRMKYYNNDGDSAEMCGNGGRCIAGFAASKGLVPDNEIFRFRSDAGIHYAEITGGDSVRLWMTDPEIHYFDRKIKMGSDSLRLSFLNTGVPHAVVITDESEKLPFTIAPELRKHVLFGKDGANVDFVRITGKSELSIRTWERGVEGETLACGTGAVASAICVVNIHEMGLPVNITVKSGRTLKVGRDEHGWWLQGEARTIYSGVLNYPLNTGLTVAL